MSKENRVSDADWLDEAARYFEKRPTGGEDMAFWANVSNAERCRSIAQSLRSKPVAGVEVKPLEWDDQVDANGNWSSRATDEFGRKYRVSHEDAVDGDWYWFGALRFTSPEQAKAAAQRRAATPSEPTEAMLNAARDWSVKKYGQGIGNDAACGCWGAMYAAIDSRILSTLSLPAQEPKGFDGWRQRLEDLTTEIEIGNVTAAAAIVEELMEGLGDVEEMATIVSQPEAVTMEEMAERVWLAVLDCPHTITGDKITLGYSVDKEGRNATHQLRERIAAALSKEPTHG